jgi:hypothetical protein
LRLSTPAGWRLARQVNRHIQARFAQFSEPGHQEDRRQTTLPNPFLSCNIILTDRSIIKE